MEEIGSSDISIMVREVYREVGVDYPEEVNEDKEECKYCGGDCPNDEEHACDGYLGDIDDLYKVTEAKDKVTYDPKTGKLTGWEHEGDWKKSKGKKKDPVGKIHHMSDVARRRTEKMAKDETLEEAFERLVNEDTINVGDIIRKKDEPEIQGKVKRIDPDKYIIDVDGDEYHIAQANAEKIPKSLHEAVDLKQLIGQEVYVPSEGTTGKILKLAPGTGDEPAAPGGPKFSNSIVIQLKNGRQTVAHFKDVTATKPGALQQFLDKVKSVVGVGTQPKYQPKPIGQVSDLNTPKQFQKLAGLK
jgi:predicted RNA-binding protein